MKKIAFIITGFFIASLSMRGQNSWFIDFGQSVQDVKAFLGEKHYLREVREDADLQRLLAVIQDDKQVEYAFKNGKLYATSLSKYYQDKQEARLREESCLNYLNLISNGNVTKGTEGRKESHTVITSSRVIKFFVIPEGDGRLLQLSAFSRLYGDINSDSQFFYELKVLEDNIGQE
jgi:hypothetical protein